MNSAMLAQYLRKGLLVLCGCLLLFEVGCSQVSFIPKPPWVDGESPTFSSQEFLVGRGMATTRSAATERAYRAVARIFQTHVTTQTTDRESYRLTEEDGSTREKRELSLELVTELSTDKMLEQVQVLDSWFDHQEKLHHILAGLNRQQAETTLMEKIQALDQRIQDEYETSQQNRNHLSKIRKMSQALTILKEREALNSDLRVIRSNGQGHPSLYRVGELTGQLDSYMANNLVITVDMKGTPAMEARQSLIEGLLAEQLPVRQQDAPYPLPTDSPSEEERSHLGINGYVTTWTTAVGDPEFHFVKWCIDVMLVDHAQGQIVGVLSRRGRESQLTLQAAQRKAVRVMLQHLSKPVAQALAMYVYGRGEAFEDSRGGASCPRSH